MAQQTRKDPRAKVLSMTVRYKSATLDEFIEHHSHDVSRGGMFIKTPQPFPPGTLLKFEVRIAEDRKVMQGVGRVVWKRDGATSDAERPSGMGVKFIKLDDESRGVIDQLLLARQEETSAFDSEGEGDVDGEARLGLGLTSTHPGSSESLSPTEGGASFFPKLEPAVLPPPEDRTVMKQAAELLEEALREVGSDGEPAPEAAKVPEGKPAGKPAGKSEKLASLAPAAEDNEETKPGRGARSDDSVARLPVPQGLGVGGVGVGGAGVNVVGSNSGAPAAPHGVQAPGQTLLNVASASKLVASAKATKSHEGGLDAKKSPSADSVPSIPSDPRSTRPETPKPRRVEASARQPGSSSSSSSTTPPKAVAAATAKEAPASSGGNRGILWLLAVAASVGVIYYVTRTPPIAAPPPEAPAIPTAPPEVTAAEASPTAPAPVPSESASEPPPASAVPTPSEAPPTAPAPTEAAVPPVPSAPEPVAAPKPAPAKPAPAKPAPAKPAPAIQDVSQAPVVAAEPAEAPAKPVVSEPKPAETPAATEPKAPARPKAAPKPAESDNPY